VKYLLAIIGIVAAFTAFPALADVTGAARVVDGDTIWIGDTKIRLHGIDAPEAKQSCIMDNQPWRCGEAATEALARLVQRQAGKIGLDASQFGAHSTRSGFVTSALPAGASINRVQDVTRHKSVEVLM
jgi:hypothetical protein